MASSDQLWGSVVPPVTLQLSQEHPRKYSAPPHVLWTGYGAGE